MERVGAYRLVRELGAGGMGKVFLARSERGRTVAVKVVREELAAREEFRERFRQEVAAARRVGGYWTAPVLDADTEAEVPWVATGYVAGPSLERVVGHDHGPLPERSVRILAAGLAHALRDIHAAGIVHRDLKPSNVLVTIDGPRVIDFGIARALETTAGGGLTRTGSLVGSPGFMAPEQVRGERVTPACDVFCLGSVLVYAATGAMPFGDADSGVHALMFRIAQEEPDLGGVPEGIADLVRQCLRKDPAARPTLDRVLEITGAENTVLDGRARDPWLPGSLVAQLARQAAQLLDTENPEDPVGPEDPGGSERAQGPEGPVGPEDSVGPEGSRGPSRDAHAETVRLTPGPPFPPLAPLPVTSTAEHAPAHHPHLQAHPHPAPLTAPYGYAPPPVPPAPRTARSTALLVAIALVVALGAGGSVYALLTGGGTGDGKGNQADPSVSSTAERPAPTRSADNTPAKDAATAPADGGAVPSGYLGSWTATITNDNGLNTRRLTIKQGEVGDTVLSLVADGPSEDGTGYHCVFEATLGQQPSGEGPLEVGPSTVTTGDPLSSCTPGAATEITLLPDGSLRRARADGGESLTYTRE